MINKLFSIIIKPLGSYILWIGGSLAAITAIFYAIGFLVTYSHQELLGIIGIVPISSQNWTVEGGRFIYNSLLYLFGGFFFNRWLLLLVVASVCLFAITFSPKWTDRIHRITKYSLVKAIIISVLLVCLAAAIVVFLHYQRESHLLVNPLTPNKAIQSRSTQEGIRYLRMQYALLEAMLLFFFIWLMLLPHLLNVPPRKEMSDSVMSQSGFLFWFSLCNLVLWFLFVILMLLLPMNYGKMVKSNQFHRARLFQELQRTGQHSSSGQLAAQYEGWVLYKDSSEIIIYDHVSGKEPIHIFKRSDFAHIQILQFDNIFSKP